jgi:2,3-bisphosphoglycerate-independent phosphoglycerate mutase
MDKQKVILVIRDGWGYRKSKKENLIATANTPFTDSLLKNYPNTLIDCSGEAVGLPKNFQGNSEVGHITIGSGRKTIQSLTRINNSISNKSFFKNTEFLNAINVCKKNNSTLHLVGLIQTEGVHAHIDHLIALLNLCKMEKFRDVKIHIITDGRDAPVKESLKHTKTILEKIKKLGFGEISTIGGRYYAMDRNENWSRIKKYYSCFVNGEAKEFNSPLAAIKNSHKEKITDEFILPTKKKGYGGVKENDSIIFFNYRTDRARQLTKSIIIKNFKGWKRKKGFLKNILFVAMTEYYDSISSPVAFAETKIENTLGEVISKNKLKQLRISETEKYAHVTFFFNAQEDMPNKLEKRILVKSPNVTTYDLSPSMSVHKIKNKLVNEINKNKFDFIVVNLVNADMVGHTGKRRAIIKSLEEVDKALEKIILASQKNNYAAFIFADHGNAEDHTIKWRTSHTTNPVHFILVSDNENLKKLTLKKGRSLCDIAPTVLKIMGIKQPKEMNGKSLI